MTRTTTLRLTPNRLLALALTAAATAVASGPVSDAEAASYCKGQVATIVGPVAGGLLYGVNAETAYGTAFILMCAAAGLVLFVSNDNLRKGAALNAVQIAELVAAKLPAAV